MPSNIYVLKLQGTAVQGLPLKVAFIHPGTPAEAQAWAQQSFANLLKQGNYELVRYDCQLNHAAAVLCAEFPLQQQVQPAQQPAQPAQGPAQRDSMGYVPIGKLDQEDLL